MFEIIRKIQPVTESQPETRRGGCLDAIVTTLSLGYLGVETTATYGWKDDESGKIYHGYPEDLVLQTGKTVLGSNARQTEHDVSRRLVRNSKSQ